MATFTILNAAGEPAGTGESNDAGGCEATVEDPVEGNPAVPFVGALADLISRLSHFGYTVVMDEE